MTRQTPEQSERDGTDVTSDAADQACDQTKMNAPAETPEVEELAKDLRDSLVVSHENTGDSVGAIDEAQIKAAAKKAAMNKRKRENAKRNKADARSKATEDATLQQESEPAAAKSTMPGEMPEMGSKEDFDSMDQVLGVNHSQFCIEHIDELEAMLEEAKMLFAFSKGDLTSEDMDLWNKLAADVWRGYEEDDVEGDIPVPGVPAFEVKQSPSKGLGLFATRNIQKGAEIFREAPLIKAKITTQSLLHLEAFFQVLAPDKKAQVLALTKFCSCNQIPCVDSIFKKIWDTNSIRIVSDSETDSYLFNIASRLNHDCRPSSYCKMTEESHIVFFACRGIRRGEEITRDYKHIPGFTELRRLILRETYGFTCECSACVANVVMPQGYMRNVSDKLEDLEGEVGGKSVLGLPSVEETSRAAEALSWVVSMQVTTESSIQRAMHIISSDVLHLTPSNVEYESLAKAVLGHLRDKFKEANSLCIAEVVLDTHIDSLFKYVLARVADSFEQIKAV